MKLCVFINGTNCVGKTSLAKSLAIVLGGHFAEYQSFNIMQQWSYCVRWSVQ